ncbi:MAG: radical SAM protein, partial [Crenarchaeota archaeon]|nr:radical SAM protein [Thermoproteota archaeon]
MENVERLAFGPVPSRRLGKSLGVNNILPKHCTYSCVYCQVGKNTEHAINRKFFHSPENILIAVKNKLNKAKMKNETVNYITLVSDGEPTLDMNLGKIVSSLKQTNLPVAVLTNASLLWMPEVQEDLLSADYVSLKVDAISEYLWKKVDR